MLEAPDDMEEVVGKVADETVCRFALMAPMSGWLAFSQACLSGGTEASSFLHLPVWTGCCGCCGVYL